MRNKHILTQEGTDGAGFEGVVLFDPGRKLGRILPIFFSEVPHMPFREIDDAPVGKVQVHAPVRVKTRCGRHVFQIKPPVVPPIPLDARVADSIGNACKSRRLRRRGEYMRNALQCQWNAGPCPEQRKRPGDNPSNRRRAQHRITSGRSTSPPSAIRAGDPVRPRLPTPGKSRRPGN